MPRKHKSSGPAAPAPLAGPQRLNKLLAAAGLGSRREVEQYILEGRIEIDGQPVTDLATKVDPETTQLTFDGSAIKIFRPVYFALNKPVGVLSTNRDPSGRMRAIDLINVKERIFSAGRLDRSSEGLMLLTNDGELAQRLSHPRYGIQKLYLATVQGEVTQADLEKLIRGVRLAEGYAKVDAVKLRKQRSGAADLEIGLSEGKNREIRRILARLGHKVVGLKRLAIGPLRLGQLPTGGWRPLTKHEIQALYAAATTGRRKKRGTGKPLRKPRTGDEDAAAPAMAAGQFDRYSEDDYEEDFGPSLDEIEGDGDEEMIVLGDDALSGTVIPYDDEDVVDDDGGSMEDMFGDEDEDDDDFDDDEISDEDEAPPRRSPSPRNSREPSSTRSPHDLRNRNRATGGGRGERTGYQGAQGSRGSRPSGGGPRGAKKTSSRPASSGGPRTGGPRSSGSRTGSSGPRTGAPRAGAPRSSSGPRSSGPRSGTASSGRPAQGGAGRSAPSRSAPSRTGTSGPGRSGAGRSGPGRSSGQGGAGRSGPGASSGPRSGPSRGGPNRGGGQNGPSRGGSSGPSRGGPRSGGPRSGGSGRGGPGRSGPGKGRGGGGKR